MAPGIHWRKKRKKWYLALLNFCRLLIRKFGAFRWMHPRKGYWGGVYMRKLAPAWVSYRDDFLISDSVYMMTESFHISLFEGTLHVDKIQVRFKIANITHALPVPVYRQTDFTPKRVSRLHDTVARFRTGVKFSPRYSNRGDSRRYDILWWYHVTNIELWEGIGVNSLRRESRSCVIVSH